MEIQQEYLEKLLLKLGRNHPQTGIIKTLG